MTSTYLSVLSASVSFYLPLQHLVFTVKFSAFSFLNPLKEIEIAGVDAIKVVERQMKGHAKTNPSALLSIILELVFIC